MARRTYTATQRAEALALYVEHGAAETARRTGIAVGTLQSWAHRNGVKSVATERTAAAVEAAKVQREELRERLRYQLLERAADMLARMDDPHIDFKGKDAQRVEYPKPSAAGCQAYATAAAILIDKLRLELGESTGRQEHHVHAHSPMDDELQQLTARLAEHDPVDA